MSVRVISGERIHADSCTVMIFCIISASRKAVQSVCKYGNTVEMSSRTKNSFSCKLLYFSPSVEGLPNSVMISNRLPRRVSSPAMTMASAVLDTLVA